MNKLTNPFSPVIGPHRKIVQVEANHKWLFLSALHLIFSCNPSIGILLFFWSKFPETVTEWWKKFDGMQEETPITSVFKGFFLKINKKTRMFDGMWWKNTMSPSPQRRVASLIRVSLNWIAFPSNHSSSIFSRTLII